MMTGISKLREAALGRDSFLRGGVGGGDCEQDRMAVQKLHSATGTVSSVTQ